MFGSLFRQTRSEGGREFRALRLLPALSSFYSFGNIMLIARQKPDATNVAGLRT